MNINNIIDQYRLREAKQSSLTLPESVPSDLLRLFGDSHAVEAYTNDGKSV